MKVSWKMEQERGSRVEGGRARQREGGRRETEIKEMRIQYGYVIKDLESLESPILNTGFATCSY